MNRFLLDASALAKRYQPEIGSNLVDHLFDKATRDRLLVAVLGVAEVVSVLVRHRNRRKISAPTCTQQISAIRAEMIEATEVQKIEADNDLIVRSLDLIDRYSINANDAVVLRVAIDVANGLRTSGDDLVLLAADQRLLKAAQAEGLVTFDPESQTQADLDMLIGP